MAGERPALCRLIAALLLGMTASGSIAMAEEVQPSAPASLVGATALRPFFAALAAVERQAARQPVRILQIGDSHTANDAFSGRLRERLQQRFGAAGRGWLPAGIPFKYYRPQLVTVDESGWHHLAPADDAKRLGLDAGVAEATEPGARMTLSADESDGFDRVAIEFIARPHGEPLLLQIDDHPAQSIPTAWPRVVARISERLLPAPAHRLQLSASEPGMQVLAWGIESRRAGVVYENHGKIGATAALLPALDPATVSLELSERRPALLVIAFGTNEGFKDELDLATYAAQFRRSVAALQRWSRGAAVLIVGPPDGNRHGADCAPATRSGACDAAASCGWAEPPNVAKVREVQRHIAAAQGWAFWDWSAAMGGSCSIDRWLHLDPPLAQADHVHLNKAGYAATADILFAALMKEYDGWKQAPNKR
jgi:lysophospholipase L1-like esterase